MKKLLALFLFLGFVAVAHAGTITISGGGSGDMTKAVYDTDADNKVDTAETLNSSGINWSDLQEIKSANLNWPDIEAVAPITEAMIGDLKTYITSVNWSDIPLLTSSNMNWPDIETTQPITEDMIGDLGSYITAADVPANETDAAHDNCSEITGCVVGAITAVASDSDWMVHGSYPSGCSAGQYVSAIGDTLTCSAPTESDPQVDSLTQGKICRADSTPAVDCDLDSDGSGDCAAGVVCTGGHSHSDKQDVVTAGRSLTFATATMNADAELYAYRAGYGSFNPVATDDVAQIDYFKLPVTITEYRCYSDQTVVVQLQRDDGSAANMFTADVTCDSDGGSACASGCDTTLVDAEDNMAATNKMGLVTVSVSGTPTKFTSHWFGDYDD